MRKNKKNGILVLAIIAILGASTFGAYKYFNYKNYKKLADSGNTYLEKKDYNKAISTFKESLKYKYDKNIKNSLELAEDLKEDQDAYNKALKFFSEKKYLQAITELKKIKSNNKDLYNKALDKINECTKEYVKVNIESAKEAISKGDYIGAKGYLSLVLAQDSSNSEALELIKKCEDVNKTSDNKNSDSNTKNSPVTKEQAESLIISLKKFENNIKCTYDHDDKKDGRDYYVLQAYESMQDHIATIGWYYVEKSTGKAFEYDIIADKLIPLN